MMDSWVPMGDEALTKYREMQTIFSPPRRCPGCDTLDGDHYLECEVGAHQTALALLGQCAPEEAEAKAWQAALEWSEAWMDPFCPEARHWRLVAEEIHYLSERKPC